MLTENTTATTTTNPQLAALQASFANEFGDEPVELAEPAPEPKVKKSAKAKAPVIKQSLITETAIEPEINLPRVSIVIGDVRRYHHEPEKLVAIVREQVGSIVFDMTSSKSRAACNSQSASTIRCITPASNASNSITEDAKKTIDEGLHFRKTFESGIRGIAKEIRKPLTEWEAEQDRIAQDKARIDAEALELQRLADKLSADWDAALVEDELICFRKEKAARELVEQEELKAKQQAEYERELKEQAAQNERERIAAEQLQREADQAREVERIEKERLDAISRAEQAELDKLEVIASAEREKLATEQRIEQAKQAAERDAKVREQTAIDNERKRVELEAKKKAGEQAKIDAEEKRKAADMTHRGTINNQIYLKLATLGVGDELAKTIIRAAVKGELGAMVVNY